MQIRSIPSYPSTLQFNEASLQPAVRFENSPAAPSVEKGKYEDLDIVKVNVMPPRQSFNGCYSSTWGWHSCANVPMVIVHRSKVDQELRSISTNHYVDGDFVKNIRKDFGSKHAQTVFNALKKTLSEQPIGDKDHANLAMTEKTKAEMDVLLQEIDAYEKELELAKKPDQINDRTAIKGVYELAVAGLKTDATSAEKQQWVARCVDIVKTLKQLLKNPVADLGSSLTPFVGDARDLYELYSGRDLFTKEKLSGFERVLSGVGLIGGSGSLFRKAISKLDGGVAKKALKKAKSGIPGLTHTGTAAGFKQGRWVSDAGLVYDPVKIYGNGSKRENRLRHILKHANPDASKAEHTVFKIYRKKDLPRMLDQAWKKKTVGVKQGKRMSFPIDMGRQTVGTAGEKHMVLVVQGEKKHRDRISSDRAEICRAYCKSLSINASPCRLFIDDFENQIGS